MKNRTYFYFTAIMIGLLIIACSSEPKSEEILIGNTVKVRSSFVKTDLPDITFYWSFGKRPLTSLAKIIVDHNQVLFTPDIPGDYTIICRVISPNDELSQDVFHFLAVSPDSTKSDYAVESLYSDSLDENITTDVTQPQMKEKSDLIPTNNLDTSNLDDNELITANKISDTEIDSLTTDFNDKSKDSAPTEDTIKVNQENAAINNLDIEEEMQSAKVPEEKKEPIKVSQESQSQNITNDKTRSMPSFALPGSGVFTLQISSWKKESLAIAKVNELKLAGIDAHIERTYMTDSDQIWFRVRVGNFKNYRDAVKAKQFVSSKINTDIWIDRVKKRN